MRYFTLLILLATPWAWAGSGSYFVCTDSNGQKSFQSAPCADNAAEAERKDYQVHTPTAPTQQYSIQGNDLAQDLIRSNKERRLNRDISNSEKKLKRYADDMDTEIAALRKKKSYANNNLAGAQWETSISQEMSAVTNKYKALMDAERDKLSRLRDELAGLD